MVALLVWGGVYIASCLETLSAPGVPIRLDYASPGGKVTLTAASFNFDTQKGRLRVIRPQLVGPEGPLASADAIVADGLWIDRQPNSPVRVDLRNANAVVRRQKGGRFEFQDYLPETEGPPTAVPFAVTADSVRLTYIDRTTAQPWSQTAVATNVRAEGIGDRWLASTEARIADVGQLMATVQSLPERGLLIEGRTTGLELGLALNRFRRTQEGAKVPELRDVRIGRLVATGPLTVFVPREAPAQLALDVRALGENVGFADYQFSSADFQGTVTLDGAKGAVIAVAPGLRGRYLGAVRWDDGIVTSGALDVTSPTLASTPRWFRSLIPAEISYQNAAYAGWVSYDDTTGFRLAGPMRSAWVRAYGEEFRNATAQFQLDPDRFRLSQVKGVWSGSQIDGAFALTFADGSLAAGFRSPSVDLRPLARRFRIAGVEGRVAAEGGVRGTLRNPRAFVRATGSAAYEDRVRGRVDVAVRYEDGGFLLTRGVATTNLGQLVATASADAAGRVKGRFEVADLRGEAIEPSWRGAARLSGVLGGTVKNPTAQGYAEAYNVGTEDFIVPFAKAQIEADQRRVRVTSLTAVRGPAELSGNAELRLSDRALTGRLAATNVLISEFLSEREDVVGAVDVPQATLSGTLANPRLVASVTGSNLFFQGRGIEQASGRLIVDTRQVSLERLTATLLNGTLNGQGFYRFASRRGQFSLEAANLALQRLRLLPAEGGGLEGLAAVRVAGSIEDGKVSGSAEGELDELRLNNTPFGGGEWQAALTGDVVSGNLRIGSLEGYQQVDRFAYNLRTEELEALVRVANTPIADLQRATRRWLPELPPRVATLIRGTTGRLNTELALAGPIRDPNVDLQLLEVQNLNILGRDLGNVQASVRRQGDLWTEGKVDWRSPAGRLSATGNADLNGDLTVDAELTNFDLSVLGLANEGLSGLQGRGYALVQGRGPSDSPRFRASLETEPGTEIGFRNPDGTITTVPNFSLLLDSITLTEAVLTPSGYTGGLDVDGRLNFRGVEAKVTANLPILYPFQIPSDARLFAAVTLPERPIAELRGLLPGLDAERTRGTVAGLFSVTGPLDNLAPRGNVTLVAETVGLQDSDLTLRDVRVAVGLEPDQATGTLNALNSAGGTIDARVAMGLPPINEVVDLLANGRGEELLARRVQGEGNIRGFVLRQSLPGRGFLEGNFDASLALSDSLRSPLITGSVSVANGALTLPSEEVTTPPRAPYRVDPRFRIALGTQNPATVRTSTATLDLAGQGSLAGSLNAPDLAANLEVIKGTFRLPTARVALDPGGTVRAQYDAAITDAPAASIDVDLSGRTRVTARGANQTVQRYDVRLDIRGDLLRTGGLNIDATSNPPDLTRDQILAMLGQADALQGLATINQRESEERIRAALTTIAVPSLLDPITSRIGSAFGLEYLNLEYDIGAQASVVFAKSLGSSFTLFGRRQLSEPLPGFQREYDLQLQYRPASLRRFSFSVGFDQDRPFKLQIEYGFRF